MSEDTLSHISSVLGITTAKIRSDARVLATILKHSHTRAVSDLRGLQAALYKLYTDGPTVRAFTNEFQRYEHLRKTVPAIFGMLHALEKGTR